MTKFSYWYDPDYYFPFGYRRTDGHLYQQLKGRKSWGPSVADMFYKSRQIPNTVLLLVGGAP
jgi:hypothetical protein